MTSQEIKDHIASLSMQTSDTRDFPFPFWEIAYQLAVMNERQEKPLQIGHAMSAHEIEELARQGFQKVQSLGSPVNPDSHTEVRGSGPEGFEPPPTHCDSIHTYRRSHPYNRFCGKCGAGEFHNIHSIPEHMRGSNEP